MQLVVRKRDVNFLLMLAMIIWYTVPIVQERCGMLFIAGLIVIWGLTCDFSQRRIAYFLLVPYAIMMFFLSLPILFGKKYYGQVEIPYFLCSSFLVFFPILLFFYYAGHTTKRENTLILSVFFFGLAYGAVNTYIVLQQYPMASRLLATSHGDKYSKMGAGGYGFAYLLMFTFPLLFEMFRRKGLRWKIGSCGLMILFFLTLIKCEYTTCLLLLFLGIALYILCRIHVGTGILLILASLVLFGVSGSLENIFLWLADWFKNTEVIATRLKDIANVFGSNSLDVMDSSRYSLYKESFSGFMQSPIWGTVYNDEIVSGGHSTVLDTMAIYGGIGLVSLLAAFYIPLRAIFRNIGKNGTYIVVVILFSVLSFLNPTIYVYQLGIVVFFIAPITLKTFKEKNQK